MTADTTRIDLFVIGAMKGATTTMCDWLAVQPTVAMSEPKEPGIFVSDDTVRSWRPRMATLFASGESAGLRAEGSTDYAKFPTVVGVPERVHRHNPDARIVYMMREPITRAISQYRFDWLQGGARMPFDRAVRDVPQLVDNGRYALQLRQWLNWFPPEQFVLVFTEAFSASAPAQVARVLDGLVDRATAVVEPEADRRNETSELRRQTLARRVLRQSWLGRRVRPLVPDAVTDAYRRRVEGRSQPAVSDRTRARLSEVYDADLADLTALTAGPGITCESWRDVAPTWTPALVARKDSRPSRPS